MTTHAQAVEAAGRVHWLIIEYGQALDVVAASLGDDVWVGGGASEFSLAVAAQRQRVRQALDDAASDADRLVALTPAETGAG